MNTLRYLAGRILLLVGIHAVVVAILWFAVEDWFRVKDIFEDMSATQVLAWFERSPSARLDAAEFLSLCLVSFALNCRIGIWTLAGLKRWIDTWDGTNNQKTKDT